MRARLTAAPIRSPALAVPAICGLFGTDDDHKFSVFVGPDGNDGTGEVGPAWDALVEQVRAHEHGWANVDELVKGIASLRPFTLEMLEEIVATDSKGRYSFNEDHSLVRANQGHSVDVDVELEPKDPPEALYHGTAQRFLGSIMKQGLLPKGRLYVHLSSDGETAIKVGSRHGSPVILKVDTCAMHEEGFEFFLSKNGVWLTKHVPAKYLTIIETD